MRLTTRSTGRAARRRAAGGVGAERASWPRSGRPRPSWSNRRARSRRASNARTRSAVAEWMREKLRAPEGRQVYARRKAIVEPVFGQAKEGRAFRRFSFRGYDKVIAEWALICLTHNQLKLFRVRTCPQPA